MEWLSIKLDLLTQLMLGTMGAGVRVLIAHDKNEPQSRAKIAATFISGTILASTSSYTVTEYVGLSPTSAGAVSFLIGVFGLGFIYQILEGRIKVPFITQGKK